MSASNNKRSVTWLRYVLIISILMALFAQSATAANISIVDRAVIGQVILPKYPLPDTLSFSVNSTFGDRDVFNFNVNNTGIIDAQATWTGTASSLALILNGPGQVGYYARNDGTSPLSTSYTVTSADLSKGTGWTISIVNFAGGTASGTITLTYPKGAATTVQPTSISVSSNPSGASIFLDGVDTGKLTPSMLTNVSAGTHSVSVSMGGYTSSPSSQTVTVTSGGTANAVFTLTPISQVGSISVSSTASGARIYLDGSDTGKLTPSTLANVPAGTHSVSVELSGYTSSPFSQTVTVTNGNIENAAFTLTQIQQFGTISINSIPAGASIYIDGVNYGETPRIIDSISAGDHLIELTLREYKNWSRIMKVEAGSTLNLLEPLTPGPSPVTSQTTSQPQTVTPARTPEEPPSPAVPWYSIIIFLLIVAILASIYIIRRNRKTEPDEDLAKIEEWKKEGYDVSELDRSLKGKK